MNPSFFSDEAERNRLFPITKEKVFFAHAGVAPLPHCVSAAICDYTIQSSRNPQEFEGVLGDVKKARALCARFIGADADEIALLGPTSLGLSLFANGIPWEAGDEVLCYHGDYPANVYPWIELRRKGVTVRYLEPESAGEITPELVEAALTPKTRLVALASCHFFTGTRIDVEGIGAILHARGILFSLDAIQTLGAFSLDVKKAHVDFLSADAHKWMLGPVAIGIVYVARRHLDFLRPTLLGAWNVVSPNFVAKDEVTFVPGAQRYEPGVLNLGGIYGMAAGIEMFESYGIDQISSRLLELKAHLLATLDPLGFDVIGHRSGPLASGITTVHHPSVSNASIFHELVRGGVDASLRHDREGKECLRFSPHFYNTEEEIERLAGVLKSTI